MRARLCFAALAALTVAVGLLVHRGVVPLPAAARDVTGDALWAAMVFWLVSALRPSAALGVRAAGALAIAWLVEFGQLVRLPWLVALRATPLGHLVLGADFDARDLLAYALGEAAAVGLEAAARSAATATRVRHADVHPDVHADVHADVR